jgi:hypothetical protein
MAVKSDPDRVLVKELIDTLVVREIPGQQQVVDKVRVGLLPGTIDVTAINGPDLNDTIRVAGRERQGRAVEVNHHPRDGGVDICFNRIAEVKKGPCSGVAVPQDLFSGEEHAAGDLVGDFGTSMRDGEKEGVLRIDNHLYQNLCRRFLLIFGSEMPAVCDPAI